MVMPELLIQYANGNFHREPSLRWLYLGVIQWDWFDHLVDECLTIFHNEEPSDVTAKKHVTNWTKPKGEVRQWSLFNTSGKTSDTSTDFDYGKIKNKRVNQKYGALEDFAESIPDLANLRLNAMGPQSALSPHEEYLPFKLVDNGVGIRARFHIPILTNDGAWVLADNRVTRFIEGALYLFNNGCVHGAGNDDKFIWRLHLVFDCLVTERLYQTMFQGSAENDLTWLTRQVLRPTEAPMQVDKWEPSGGGISEEEFNGREFGWMPV